MKAKIVYAGSNNTSYEQAEADLINLAELKVGDKQIRRVCKEIGDERRAERDAEVAAYQAMPLAERKAVPAGVTAPKLAVVGVDGGRLQIIDRSAKTSDAVIEETAPADKPPAAEDGEEREDNGRHWREDKIGLLMTMSSEVSAVDPCPEIPENFVNPLRILKLARELKKRVPAKEEAAKAPPDLEAEQQAYTENATKWEPPEVLEKRLVATRRPWESFGPMVAAAAWLWGFFGAEQRASWATARTTTGLCGGTTSLHLCRSWISSTRFRTCSRRQRRDARSRKVGRSMCAGSLGCGRGESRTCWWSWRRDNPS